MPLTFNDGSAVPGELVEQTREEMLARFGGATLSPGTFRGTWVHEGTRYEDESIRLMVDAEETPEARQFFVELKPILRERFQQIEIYITSYLIEVI